MTPLESYRPFDVIPPPPHTHRMHCTCQPWCLLCAHMHGHRPQPHTFCPLKRVQASCLAFRAAVIVCRRWPKRERTSSRRHRSPAKQAQEPDWVGSRRGRWRQVERDGDRERERDGDMERGGQLSFADLMLKLKESTVHSH